MVLGSEVGPDGNTPPTAVVETVARDTANTKNQVVAAWGYGVTRCWSNRIREAIHWLLPKSSKTSKIWALRGQRVGWREEEGVQTDNRRHPPHAPYQARSFAEALPEG